MHLTIVTVAGPNDGDLVARNARLIETTNRNTSFRLHVVDNSRHAGGKPVESSRQWELIDGVDLKTLAEINAGEASLQHGAALNKFLRSNAIRSRYVMVLDPDFFIYRREWIEEITSYMKENNLAFFGAPWHPKWYTKYRSFPCVHCMVIDTQKIEIDQLDFTPDLRTTLAAATKKTGLAERLKSSPVWPLCSVVYSATMLRLDIGRTKDTGGRVFEMAQEKSRSLKWSLLKPLVRHEDMKGVPHLRYRLGRSIEALLPADWSFMPYKRSDYTRTSMINPMIQQQVLQLGWEEFQWKGKLFGIHMRRFSRRKESHADALPLQYLDILNDLHTQIKEG